MDNVTDISEQIESLQNLLIAVATGGSGDAAAYRELRNQITTHHLLRDIAPRFVRTCRSTSEFWQFIKYKFSTYAERRDYIWNEFRPMLDRLEGARAAPSDHNVSVTLAKFDADSVHQVWLKALERRESDPEGAITLARTLLESVCKHVLDQQVVTYKADADLPDLYKATAKTLNIAPSQHSEQIFKQILGGCTAVVEGLGALRNRLSDAHGQGKKSVKPASRHAELAVNLAGAVAIFLIATNDAQRR
jgi:hypothetical protein